VALAFFTVWAAISCFKYNSRSRELRRLQMNVAQINGFQTQISALANEAMEYSKKNPSIDPILESIGMKPAKTNSTPAAKPAGK
jgi:hypothetical protein